MFQWSDVPFFYSKHASKDKIMRKKDRHRKLWLYLYFKNLFYPPLLLKEALFTNLIKRDQLERQKLKAKERDIESAV